MGFSTIIPGRWQRRSAMRAAVRAIGLHHMLPPPSAGPIAAAPPPAA